MDLLNNPIMVLILALLAVPAVTSALAGVLKRAQDATGIPSRVFVYVASLVVTGVLLWGAALPAWTGEPVVYVGAWLTWLTVNAELARRVYELVHERLEFEPV